MGKSLSQQEFIQKARAIHGNKYDYSKISYLNTYTRINITCYKHGEFSQYPSNHLNGKGCPNCKSENISLQLSSTTNKFIEKAKVVHNDKYDYSKVKYKNNFTKVCIICATHGEFWQRPNNHLSGKGCVKCRDKQTSLRFKTNIKQFIQKAMLAHDKKYNYDKVNYIGTHNKIIITCHEHGDFEQLPSSHLQGHGCPGCKSSKGELAIKSILDKHNIVSLREWKHPDEDYLYEYDFYLPELNILIEFHGRQHYEYNSFFHRTYHDFEEQCLRDSNKLTLAKVKQIPLLEFNYKQLDNLPQNKFEELVINKLNKFNNR